MPKKKDLYPHIRKLNALRMTIIARCTKPEYPGYTNYGGRGIKVCRSWLRSSEAFYKWATGNGYTPGLQIDRINNDGNYEPSNCRFVTGIQNQNNRRNSRFLMFKGKRQTVAQWARELDIDRRTLQTRLGRGWSVERALTQEVQYKNAFA